MTDYPQSQREYDSLLVWDEDEAETEPTRSELERIKLCGTVDHFAAGRMIWETWRIAAERQFN
jgi:hypothetical protein